MRRDLSGRLQALERERTERTTLPPVPVMIVK